MSLRLSNDGVPPACVPAAAVAVVRVFAQKPESPVPRPDASDILGVNILGHQVQDAWSEVSGPDPADGDFLGH